MHFLKQVIVMGMASGIFQKDTLWGREIISPDDLLASLTIAVKPDVVLPETTDSVLRNELLPKGYAGAAGQVAYAGLKVGNLFCVYQPRPQRNVVT